MKSMLKPIRDNLIIEVIKQEPVTGGGIILPSDAVEKPYSGIVKAVNEEFCMPDGSIKKAECRVGDVVYFGKTHGTEVKKDGATYLVIQEDLILCKE